MVLGWWGMFCCSSSTEWYGLIEVAAYMACDCCPAAGGCKTVWMVGRNFCWAAPAGAYLLLYVVGFAVVEVDVEGWTTAATAPCSTGLLGSETELEYC